MKVTITIEDDGDGPNFGWSDDDTSAPHIRGPHIRGPFIILPQENGEETKIEIAALAAAAEQTKPESKPEG